MQSDTFLDFVATLYYVGFLSNVALVLFVAYLGSRHASGRAELRSAFVWLTVALLCWQGTLLVEVRAALPVAQIWIGRFNYTTAAVAVVLAFHFIQQIPVREPGRTSRRRAWLLIEIVIVIVATMFTPLIDASEEHVPGGRAITHFGCLYPLYLLYVLLYLGFAIGIAFRERSLAHDKNIRRQLGKVGFGLLMTGLIAFVTNGVFPYALNEYKYVDVGGLSVQVFMLSVAYGTFVNGLFDNGRYLIRESFVFGLLLAFVLGTYSGSVFLLTLYVTNNSGKLVQWIVVVIALSVDPLRRFLERQVDRKLFRRHRGRR